MKAANIIERVLRTISAILFIALIVIVFIQVFLRYFLNKPLAWSDELARLLLIWTASFGVTLIFYSKAGHPAVTVFTSKMSPSAALKLMICRDIVLVILMIVVGYYGLLYTINTHKFLSPVLEYPTSIKYVVFPLTMALMVYKGIINGITHIKELKTMKDEGVKQ